MQIKKIISLTLFSFIGVSFVCANENTLSTIKDTDASYKREIGYQFCELYAKKEKNQKGNSLSNDLLQEQIVQQIMNDNELIQIIFSGKASDDVIIHALQEGCFDFLAEEILRLTLENVELYSHLDRCHTPFDREKLKTAQPNFDFSEYDKKMCNEAQLAYRNNIEQTVEKFAEATQPLITLLDLLGLADRKIELEKKLSRLFNVNDEVDIEHGGEL